MTTYLHDMYSQQYSEGISTPWNYSPAWSTPDHETEWYGETVTVTYFEIQWITQTSSPRESRKSFDDAVLPIAFYIILGFIVIGGLIPLISSIIKKPRKPRKPWGEHLP